MKMSSWRRSLVFISWLVTLSVFEAGCIELKYSASNRLNDPVAIKFSRAPVSVYFSFPRTHQKDKQYSEYFTSAFTMLLEKKGFTVATAPASADIAIKARVTFYKKAQGSFLFVLFVPTYRFNEEYDGVLLDISYETDKGRWHKKYRVYYRGWLDGDLAAASDLIQKAIIDDIGLASNAPITGG